MRVLVHEEVFDANTPIGDLMELMLFAVHRRHRVIVHPQGKRFEEWLSRQSLEWREAVRDALDWSLTVEAVEPALHEVQVGDGPRPGAGVDSQAAIRALNQPFQVFVENDRSDRNFLETVAPSEYRRKLVDWVGRGWLLFRSNNKGVTGVEEVVRRERGSAESRLWGFALFDSDAPAPGRAHPACRATEACCRDLGVDHWMLKRRSIENYLTRAALTAWANGQQGKQASLLGRVSALYSSWFEALPARRHHFHMKDGFNKMFPFSDSIWEGLPEATKKELLHGFGNQVTEAFRVEWVHERDLRAEGAWEELFAVVERLVGCMR